MSQENVERVATGLQALAATRRPSGLAAPDWVLEMRTFRGWPDDPEYVGDEGFQRFISSWLEPYDEWQITAEEILDVEDDRVLAICRQRGRLSSTDAWVELDFGVVYTFADGRVQRLQMYATPQEAREAVGLPGGDAP